MKEIILCKYGEIVLKGANRGYFEDILLKDFRRRAAKYGNFDVYRAQSTIYLEPMDDKADVDGMFEAAGRVFGIISLCRAARAEKDMDSIAKTVREYLPRFLAGKSTFKVESKRSDKTFALDSMQISAETGGILLDACPWLRVDVHKPDIVVKVEIREYGAYIHAGQTKGAGGMPAGTNGKGLLLLSGGIDSPVAGYMMAKRGVKIEALHFESFPYTSEQARQKVISLARILSEYTGGIKLHIVSLTKIQEELMRCCEESYFTLLLRRYMMHIASKVAERSRCQAIITGESVGQVASQTMHALTVTDEAALLPVFRPCIGMDKEEIISIARRIDTFDTSILPFEDCCTVFTPKHPRTRPELCKVLAQEKRLDFSALAQEALETLYTENVRCE